MVKTVLSVVQKCLCDNSCDLSLVIFPSLSVRGVLCSLPLTQPPHLSFYSNLRSTMALSDQFEEIRRRAQSRLTLSGSIPEIRADVTTMAEMALPLSKRYQHINAEKMVLENAVGQSRHEVSGYFQSSFTSVFALSLLGCLTLAFDVPSYQLAYKAIPCHEHDRTLASIVLCKYFVNIKFHITFIAECRICSVFIFIHVI